MTKNDVVNILINDNSCLALCKKAIKTDAHKDLYQYVFLTLLETDDKKLIEIHNRVGIINYAKGIIYKSVYGNRSKFWSEYNGNISEDDSIFILKNLKEEDLEEDKLNKFDEELKKESDRCVQEGVYPAAVKIYELYEQMGSYMEVSKCTQIPYNTIQRYVQKTREKILSTLDKNSNSNTAE